MNVGWFTDVVVVFSNNEVTGRLLVSYWDNKVINRPCVAGAVLQPPPPLINSLIL